MALSCFWNFKWAIKTIKKSNCFRLESILASYLWFKRKDKGQKFIPKFCVLNSVWLAMISQILELARTNKYYAGKEIRKFYERLLIFISQNIFFPSRWMNQIQDLCTTFFQSFQSLYFEWKRHCLFNFNGRYSIFDSPFGRMKKKKKLYGPFLRIRFNCLKAIEQLCGDRLLFITKFPEIPAPNLIDLGRMTRWVDLACVTAPSGFEHETHGLGNPPP